MKAIDIIEDIKEGSRPLKVTCDTVKAGDENRAVKKLAIAMFPTVEVIRAAAEWGADMLIVHEPTYYDHMDVMIDSSVTRAKKALIDEEIKRVQSTNIPPSAEVNAFLAAEGSTTITTGIKLAELLRRPELTYEALAEIDKDRPALSRSVSTTVAIQIKYEGYIKRELGEVERQRKLESKILPKDISYKDILGLRLEAAEKLDKIRPMNIGQASRISGVNPADISVLLIYLSQK